MADMEDMIAKPSDPDLDLDVDGATVTALVRMGPELLVRMTGGRGTWIDAVEGRRIAIDGVEEIAIHVCMESALTRERIANQPGALA